MHRLVAASGERPITRESRDLRLASHNFYRLAVATASKTNGLPIFHGNHPLGCPSRCRRR